MWILHNKDKGRVDDEGEWSMYATIMKACKDKKYQTFQKNYSDYKAWSTQFLGEGSTDAGGPYRDSVTNIQEELHSKHLSILIPTQNNKNSHGFNMDCYTINPTAKSPVHMEMYKFLGVLIGFAFRSGSVFDVRFPPLIWKKLAGEELTIDDLRGSDIYAVQTIESLIENKKDCTKDTFEMAIDLTFSTQLSNGDTIPICEGGEDRKVLYEDIEEYNRLVLETRFNEANLQIEKIKEGFDIVFPIGQIGLFSWKDIESRIRGPAEILTEDLRNISTCSSSQDKYILRFWKVFEMMNQLQRQSLLKFIWGRSRLPPKERMRDQEFQIYLIGSEDNNNILPQSHTCFFQLDLPRYSSDEIMLEKLLLASETCGEIDTDHAAQNVAADYS
jgi:hypothetical protein